MKTTQQTKLPPIHLKKLLIIISVSLLFVVNACKPKDKFEEKTYKINIQTQSSLPNKQIADGTDVYLVEQGKTDSLKSKTKEGLVNFSLSVAENTELFLEIHVKDNIGHIGFIKKISTNDDKSITLKT